MKLLLALLASLSLALVVRGSGLGGFHVETFRHSPDGHHLLLRSKREAQTEVCKYKKGDWSQCDSLVMVNILFNSAGANRRAAMWPSQARGGQVGGGRWRGCGQWALILTLLAVNSVLVWLVCDLFDVMNYLSFPNGKVPLSQCPFVLCWVIL